MPYAPAGPFAIGQEHCWPGLAKLSEECGELVQVIGKMIATGGNIAHWDGSDLQERLIEEMGDVMASIDFVVEANQKVDRAAVGMRMHKKTKSFWKWHQEGLNRR